jgi:hypothetical protein
MLSCGKRFKLDKQINVAALRVKAFANRRAKQFKPADSVTTTDVVYFVTAIGNYLVHRCLGVELVNLLQYGTDPASCVEFVRKSEQPDTQ